MVDITAAVSDADATTTVIPYSLFDNRVDRFAFVSTTGLVGVASAINRETDGAIQSLTAKATSANGSFIASVFSNDINDVDEFNIGPATKANVTTNDTNWRTFAGMVVQNAAFVADADEATITITFSLHQVGGGHLAIDSTTGAVTVASAISHKAKCPHSTSQSWQQLLASLSVSAGT